MAPFWTPETTSTWRLTASATAPLSGNDAMMASRSPEMAPTTVTCSPKKGTWTAPEAHLEQRCKRHQNGAFRSPTRRRERRHRSKWKCRLKDVAAMPPKCAWTASEWWLRHTLNGAWYGAWNHAPHRRRMALEWRLNAYKEACKSALNDIFLTPFPTAIRRVATPNAASTAWHAPKRRYNGAIVAGHYLSSPSRTHGRQTAQATPTIKEFSSKGGGAFRNFQLQDKAIPIWDIRMVSRLLLYRIHVGNFLMIKHEALIPIESNSIANPIISYMNNMFNHVKKLCHKFL